jgi:hypothetical protein
MCTSATAKGDIEGSKDTVKVKEEYKGCTVPNFSNDTCQTYPPKLGIIYGRSLKGELMEASEYVGGPQVVVEKLEPEVAGQPFMKFACGTLTVQVTPMNAIFGRQVPTQVTPQLAYLSTVGELYFEEQPTIAGCGGARWLYENGSSPCEFAQATGSGGAIFSTPSWDDAQEVITYKKAVEIVG